jgi:ACS family hexuronate transporter-like MFS transporter
MSIAVPDLRLPGRSVAWKWWVCGLLMLATTINYMDRLTLNLLAPRLITEMHLGPTDYGRVEAAFAVAFAFGALFLGWLVDRWNAFWVYPLAVLAWSAAGFCTGFAQGLAGLLVCRFLLGLAESGNWPCALRTTQALLTSAERTMGNGLLQSGAAVGAVLIPFVVYFTAPPDVVGSWRTPFLVIGACGATWTALWWMSLQPADLVVRRIVVVPGAERFLISGWQRARRFTALVVLVIAINATWHFFRAWLALYLAKVGYAEETRNWFFSAYYIAADVGALSAGGATLLLTRFGASVHVGRLVVSFACALLAASSVVVAFLPAGPLLLGLLLVVAFGSLGVFPAYYSFSQELTVRHQGKLTGVLSFACWAAMAGWQETIGRVVEATQSYTVCLVISGLLPLAALVVLAGLWGPAAAAAAAVEAAAPALAPLPAADGAVVSAERSFRRSPQL